jgi:SAM-dependent methyltransferase
MMKLSRLPAAVRLRAAQSAKRSLKRAGFLPLLKRFNRRLRRLTARAHKLQFDLEWTIPPVPEWYDHFIDQHYVWSMTGNPLSWERGIFSLLPMVQGSHVLDLCCGGGFITRHFYACRAREIIAVDIDPAAVKHAQMFNAAPNIRYELCDIREGLPDGPFDNVVWDAAIEHFTEREIAELLARIKARLSPSGTLSGYTIREAAAGKSHPDHEYEFKSKEDLARFFSGFRNVMVFETTYPTRCNLYFFASDAALPFAEEWPAVLRRTSPADREQVA